MQSLEPRIESIFRIATQRERKQNSSALHDDSDKSLKSRTNRQHMHRLHEHEFDQRPHVQWATERARMRLLVMIFSYAIRLLRWDWKDKKKKTVKQRVAPKGVNESSFVFSVSSRQTHAHRTEKIELQVNSVLCDEESVRLCVCVNCPRTRSSIIRKIACACAALATKKYERK